MASGTFSSKPTEGVIIRPATLADAPEMALIASTIYLDTPVDVLLSPYRHQYREDHTRGYRQRITLRILDPLNLSVVACPISSPSTPIAYSQFVRIGTDEAAKTYRRSKASVWLTLQRWYYTIKFRIQNFLWPDRSADLEAVKRFDRMIEDEDGTHWNGFPERANRWHGQSVVVSKEWQGRGVGRKVMSEVLRRAQEEQVVIGLSASIEGEYLYRKLGFELLGRFINYVESVDEGGVMMWTPEKKTEVDADEEKNSTAKSSR